MALQERLGPLDGKRYLLTWSYHPKPLNTAVANSALLIAAKFGMSVTLLCPTEDFLLDDRYMNIATRDAGANGGSVTVTHDIETGYEGADVVYAKSWGALPFFGRWDEEKPIRDKYQDFIVDSRKMAMTSGRSRQSLPSDETQRHHDRRGLRQPELHRLRRGGEPSPRAEGDHDNPDRSMSEDRVPASPNRDVRQTIVHLLSNMSDGREIRSYLQRFSEVDRSRFAVIKIGGAILAEHLEETAAALSFLHTVGLTPIVIHGGGTQLDRALDERGIESRRIDGLRVTEPDVLDAARNTFIEQNILLVEAIREQGVAAHGLPAGAFEADYVDRDKYGLVGEPTEVHIALIRSIVDSGAIPILTCLGVAPGGQIVNMNADAATRALVHAVQPLKIIFLVDVGGLLDDNGRLIESINLASDYEHLMAQDWVHSGMRLKLAEIKRLLDDTPLSTSVSITTPTGLVKELFTHGGSGTLVRKGELIERLTDPGAIDESQVVRARRRGVREASEGRVVGRARPRLRLFVREPPRRGDRVSRRRHLLFGQVRHPRGCPR